MPAEYRPSYYLTEEAAERRIEALVKRIARDGLRPGESVPARIMTAVEQMRAGRLCYVRAAA